MPVNFFKNVAMVGWVIAACVSAVFIMIGSPKGAVGVLVGALWMFLNFWAIARIMAMVAAPGAKMTPRTAWFLVLKFPALYVAGFFILKAKIFPVESLLIGLSVFMLAMTVGWIGQGKNGLASQSRARV